MKKMKRHIFFSFTLLSVYSITNTAENTSPANIVTIFNAPSETKLKDIAFFDNNIISVGYNKQQNKILLYQFSLCDNQAKELFSTVPSDENEIEYYFIATNKSQNRAVITTLKENALLLEPNKEKPNNIPIQTNWPVRFLEDDTILWVAARTDRDKQCYVYNTQNDTNTEFPYNEVIKKLNDRKDLRFFDNQIDKSPKKNQYCLSLEIDMAIFDGDKPIDSDNPTIVPLTVQTTDRDGDPITVHFEPWDIEYSHDGSHIAFTWYIPYNAWIINPSTEKYFALEDTPGKDYSIDTKAFHPLLPIIATLRKCDGEIKFWYVPNGKCVITQILPEKTGYEPASCLTHFISFSHDAKLLAIEINRKVIIMKVPEILSELCELHNK